MRQFGAKIASAVAVFSSQLGVPAAAQPAAPLLDVWMLDVGQGSCVYVDCPESEDVLIVDCGSTRAGPAASPTGVADWLNTQLQETQTVTVILSHGDRDHVSLLNRLDPQRIDLVRGGGIRGVYVGAADGWLEAVEGAGGNVAMFGPNYFAADDPGLSCGSAAVDVLVASLIQAQPGTSVDSRKNADSAIVRVRYAGFAAIMPGDAEGSTQNAAISNAASMGLRIDIPTVVMGSHHGARTAGSNNETWVEALTPVVAAFSASLDVQFSHPQCEVVGRFETEARRASERYPVPCGVGQRREVRNVDGAVVTTWTNGLLFRLGPSGVSVVCQRMTPACDAQLETGMAPGLFP